MSLRPPGRRSLALSILGLITLPIIAGVIAGAAGAFGAGYAVSYAGLTGGSGGPTVKPTLYMPSFTPSGAGAVPMVTAPPKTLEKVQPTATAKTTSPTANAAITLVADPLTAARGDRIALTGTYPVGNGVAIQVQIYQGNKWKDFPVTAKVFAGKFSTFVVTNQPGAVEFRVVDAVTRQASNPVTITFS